MGPQINNADRGHKPDARTRVLDAAQAEFLAHGYAGASTNRILDRFGGSKATMFRHFATKEAMFAAVIGRIAERMVADGAVAAPSDADPKTWLNVYGRQAMKVTLTGDALFVARVVVAEGARFPEVRRRFVAATIEPMLNLLADRLARWTQAGLLECRDPEGDAIRFVDIVMSGSLNRCLFGAATPPAACEIDALVGEAVDIFLRGRQSHQATKTG